MSELVSHVVCASGCLLVALIFSTTLSMFFIGDLLGDLSVKSRLGLVMKSFGDDDVTIRIGLELDESEARFIISTVLEFESADISIWNRGCCFCFACCLFFASVNFVVSSLRVLTIAASLDFCSNVDVLFFDGRSVLFEGDSALRLRSVRRFWVLGFCFLPDGPTCC